MKFYKNIKRTTMQYIVVSVICIIIIGGAAFFTSIVITNQIREEYQGQLKEAYYDMEMNKRSVYIAVSDIISGELITKEKLEKKMVYSSQPQDSYMTTDQIGKIALVDITTDTQILKSMLTENSVTSELREMECNVVNINSNIVNNDTVDIRLFFPNGEDYIVLNKKNIRGLEANSEGCFLWLSEEEILRMSSAIVDAYLYNGARLYTTRYIEPNFQEASQVTYEPSVSTLLLIEKDPNIVKTATNSLSKQVRKAMENRLAQSMSTKVEEIDWELSPNQKITVEKGTEDTTHEAAGVVTKESINEAVKEPANDFTGVVDAGENATYQAEKQEKEAEMDYGP